MWQTEPFSVLYREVQRTAGVGPIDIYDPAESRVELLCSYLSLPKAKATGVRLHRMSLDHIFTLLKKADGLANPTFESAGVREGAVPRQGAECQEHGAAVFEVRADPRRAEGHAERGAEEGDCGPAHVRCAEAVRSG